MATAQLDEKLNSRARKTAAAQTGKPAGDGKGTATATADKTKAKKRGKVSALAAAETVLREEGKPLHVKEITKRIQAMPDTKLGGKTPEATVGAILAVNVKKTGSPFRRTKPSTYAIRKGK